MAYQKQKAAPKYKLRGTSMYANVYESNHRQEKEITRKDGTKWVKKAHYAISLILTPDSVKRAEKLGLNQLIRQPNDREKELGFSGPFISFETSTKLPSGDPIKAPVVQDDMGDPFDELIGNGSKVDVIFTIKQQKDAEKQKKYGPHVYIKGVTVLEHVAYDQDGKTETQAPAKDSTDFDDEIPF